MVGIGMVLVMSAATSQAEQRKLLSTKASWADNAGHSGTMLFQGEVLEGALVGLAYPGGGQEWSVSGTVDSNGAVEGTLTTALSELIGEFTGQLNAEQELVGVLTIDGEVDCEWVAPAEELPSE
jgi:hypothetical protein